MAQGKQPGIVPLLDAYMSSNCLKYEFVNGGELTGIIREARPFGGVKPVEEAARIIQQVAEIVGILHRLHPPIVQRDLKPANILVEISRDGERCFRVADFGIGGLAINQAITQTKMVVTSGQFLVSALRGSYTPLYASPQQIRGKLPAPATTCMRWESSGINC
jgi:serine/threonine protein kinase